MNKYETVKKSIQFELWRECNNFCKMCFLGSENRKTPKEIKLQSLREAIETSKVFQGDIISIIGGEFFQGQLTDPEVHDLFYEFISLIVSRLNNEEIKESWVTATLTDKRPEHLVEFLDFIKQYWNGKGRLFICTSYDNIGRFHTKQKEMNWKDNMKFINEYEPRIELNTTFILTNALIKTVLNNEFSFTSFSIDYNTGISIKHPNKGPCKTLQEMEKLLPGFLPEREKTLKFFKKLKLKEDVVFNGKIFNVELRSDKCVKRENNGTSFTDIRDKKNPNEYISSFYEPTTNTCGHSVLYQCYKDSDACMKCDYLKIKE